MSSLKRFVSGLRREMDDAALDTVAPLTRRRSSTLGSAEKRLAIEFKRAGRELDNAIATSPNVLIQPTLGKRPSSVITSSVTAISLPSARDVLEKNWGKNCRRPGMQGTRRCCPGTRKSPITGLCVYNKNLNALLPKDGVFPEMTHQMKNKTKKRRTRRFGRY